MEEQGYAASCFSFFVFLCFHECVCIYMRRKEWSCKLAPVLSLLSSFWHPGTCNGFPGLGCPCGIPLKTLEGSGVGGDKIKRQVARPPHPGGALSVSTRDLRCGAVLSKSAEREGHWRTNYGNRYRE